MDLTKDQQIDIFKRLAYKSALEVGLEFNFNEHYKTNLAIRNAVNSIYRKIKEDAEKFPVAPEVRSLVADAMAHRQVAGVRKELSAAESKIEGGDIKSLVVGVRDKALRLLDTKLTRASKTKKGLDAIPLQALTVVAGTMFDKAQILMGQATEHIAVMGKIDGNISPIDALKLVMEMRDANVSNNATNKK